MPKPRSNYLEVTELQTLEYHKSFYSGDKYRLKMFHVVPYGAGYWDASIHRLHSGCSNDKKLVRNGLQ